VNEILFYTDDKGNSPIKDFLEKLNSKQAQKVTWVLNLIEEHEIIPNTYLKKMVNTNDI